MVPEQPSTPAARAFDAERLACEPIPHQACVRQRIRPSDECEDRFESTYDMPSRRLFSPWVPSSRTTRRSLNMTVPLASAPVGAEVSARPDARLGT